MKYKPDFDTHYVLCKDKTIVDILDVLVFDTDIPTTVKNVEEQHGEILRSALSPLKLFDQILGDDKNQGKFVSIGATNWTKLFLIRGQFDGYWAFIGSGEDKKLVATSTDGLLWCFNIIDA
jgi:hypothetical protein